MGSDLRMWDPQLSALEARFRVIRYDTRGHGKSPAPDGPYTIDDLADDLIAVLDRLAIDKAHFVGLSLGGMTMLRAAARNPERVDRMALMCTAAALPAARAGYVDRAAQVRAEGTTAIADGVVGRWFTDDYRIHNPEQLSYYQSMVAATSAEGYAGCCEAIAAMDLTDDLSRIAAPTLLIAGADDTATPPTMLAQIADTVIDGTLLVVPTAAHLANVQQPQIITPAVIDHLEQP